MRTGSKSDLRVCRSHPSVLEVTPTRPCPGDEYSTRRCPRVARFRFRDVDRCTKHTASVLHDLPVGGPA